MDSLEFLELFIAKMMEGTDHCHIDTTFLPKLSKILICRQCPAIKGEIYCNAAFHTQVIQPRMPLRFESLIWDMAACQCSSEQQGPGCNCWDSQNNTKPADVSNNTQQGMYYYAWFLLESPTVLKSKTNGVMEPVSTGGLNKTTHWNSRSPIFINMLWKSTRIKYSLPLSCCH